MGLVIGFIEHLYSSWLHFTDHCHTKGQCSQSRSSLLCLVTASNSGHSSASGITTSQIQLTQCSNYRISESESESESELLYDWRFSANKLVLAPSPLRITTTDFFLLNPCSHSPYVTSSLTRGWVCLLWICFAFVKCTYRTYSICLHENVECLFFPGSGYSDKSDNLE
jgi:hypothetical protein